MNFTCGECGVKGMADDVVHKSDCSRAKPSAVTVDTNIVSMTRTVQDVFVKDVNAEERTATHIVSTSARDRMNDVVDAAGWELDRFKSNPVVLADHSYGIQGIIGTALDVTPTKKVLKATTKFHDVGLGAAAFDLVSSGMAKAWSVGFRGLEAHSISEGVKDGCSTCKRSRKDILMQRGEEDESDVYIFGRHYTKSELLEYSLVAIPANADAVMGYIQRGLVTEENADMLFRSSSDTSHFSEVTQRLAEVIANGDALKQRVVELCEVVEAVGEQLDSAIKGRVFNVPKTDGEPTAKTDDGFSDPPSGEASTKTKADDLAGDGNADDKPVEKTEVQSKPDVSARMTAMAVLGEQLRKTSRGISVKDATPRQGAD